MSKHNKQEIAKLKAAMEAATDVWHDAVAESRKAQDRAEKARQELSIAQSAYTAYLSLFVEMQESQEVRR